MYRICNEDKAAPVSGFLFWRMTTMDIRKIPVEQINPAPYNPRIDLQPGDEEYERLKRSIREFGYVAPLVWNERTGNLVGGHQRYKILMEETPSEIVVSVVDLDDAQEKALNVALNKIGGEFDMPKLQELLAELDTNGYDVTLTGFDGEELDEVLASLPTMDNIEFIDIEEDDFDEEEALANTKEPVTSRVISGNLDRTASYVAIPLI